MQSLPRVAFRLAHRSHVPAAKGVNSIVKVQTRSMSEIVKKDNVGELLDQTHTNVEYVVSKVDDLMLISYTYNDKSNTKLQTPKVFTISISISFSFPFTQT